MKRAVIAGYSRSPFTMARKGELIDVKPVNMFAEVVKNLVSKTKVNPADIEDIVVGCAFQVGEQSFNIGKLTTFLSGMEIHTSGMTVDRWCGSSMEAIHVAAGKIAMGAGKVFVCGGVESMTRVTTGFEPIPYPYTDKENPNVYFSMGITAENVAKRYKISRTEQQEFAIQSHQKANEAEVNGKFKNEIVEIAGCTKDGNIRPKSNQETLDGLKLAFDQEGTVTAATSSPLTDGAAATLICEESYAKENGLEILARIVSTGVKGCEPDVMGLGPIGATKKALERANLSINDIDIVEINEAFASQVVYIRDTLGLPTEKLNVNGGSISIGHPFGMTGSRQVGHVARELNRRGGKYGIVTMCVGGGMGATGLFEAYNS